MHELDIYTLVVLYVLSVTVSACVLFIFWIQNRKGYTCTIWWILGLLTKMSSQIVTSFSESISLEIYTLSNILIVTGAILIYKGLRVFMETHLRIKQGSYWIEYINLFLIIVTQYYFTVYAPDINLRIITAFIIISVCIGRFTVTTNWGLSKTAKKATIYMNITTMLFLIAAIARIISTIINPFKTTNYFEGPQTDTYSTAGFIPLSMLLALSMIFMIAKANISNSEEYLNLLNRTGKEALVGGWEYNLKTQALIFTEEVFHIYEIDNLNSIPQIETSLKAFPRKLRIRIKDRLKSIKEKQEDINIETPFLTQKNKKLWVRLTYKVISSNIPIILTGTIQDITTRKLTEIKLRKEEKKAKKADKLKSAFLANMSHEIRSPLNAIIGFTSILRHETSRQDHKEPLEHIYNSGKLLLNLINDILDISKIEADQLTISPCSQSIGDILKNTLKQLQITLQTFEKHNIETRISIDKQIEPLIEVDGLRLQQILTNLASNAAKFTKEGHIEIGVNLKEKELFFYVEDTGIGIPENMQKTIFKRFSQVGKQESQVIKGTGLGLAISKKLTILMKGNIAVRSQLGIGSTFSFTLPYIPTTEIIKEIKEEIIPPTTKALYTILIAEDEKINQIFLSTILNKYGYKVLKANNGKEALQIFKENKNIDMIIMDIRMPFMNGLTATKEIRNIEIQNKTKKIPIIILSAASSEPDKESGYIAGADIYLTKPVDANELITTIQSYLK